MCLDYSTDPAAGQAENRYFSNLRQEGDEAERGHFRAAAVPALERVKTYDAICIKMAVLRFTLLKDCAKIT